MAIGPEHLRHLREHVRPSANWLLSLAVNLQSAKPRTERLMPDVAALDPNTIIDDGRQDEGIPPLTAGEIVQLATLSSQLEVILTPENIALLDKASPVPPKVYFRYDE